MSSILVMAGAVSERWRAALAAALPELRFIGADEVVDRAGVRALVGWQLPEGTLRALPHLEVIFALGAGVDGLLARPDLAPTVRVVRLLDAGMAEQMLEYALLGVLSWQRHVAEYQLQQGHREWRPLRRRARGATRVAVLGLGALGGSVAQSLAELGYRVAGWSRQPKQLPGVTWFGGESGLHAVLAQSDVLINLLPSTAATRGLLNAERLGSLAEGGFVVNAARGDQLDAAALLCLLDSGRLSGALLDVFAVEPLPADSPLWRHPRVRITPHVAGITVFEDSLRQIVDNLQRWQRGDLLLGAVDRGLGY